MPLESVRLANARSFDGLIESESESEIEFVEVHRPRGRRAFVVVRTINKQDVAEWRRLPAKQRVELAHRVDALKHQALIEARRMEAIKLTPVRREEDVHWIYHGGWFWLDSTASQQTTRRAIVRIEQVFTAYRQMLPPRRDNGRPLQIAFFGSSDQYRAYLSGLGLRIENPAFFLANFNLVAAGSDMNRFELRTAEIRRQHQDEVAAIDAELASLPQRIQQLGEELSSGGFSESQRRDIQMAEQRKATQLAARRKTAIAALDRENARGFDEVAGTMFARLNHEVFHAYVENFVFPQNSHDFPRWLNEGLAQTFESGLLEADALRVDAPNRLALKQLQKDLRSSSPLPLAEVVAADASTFLSAHRAAAEGASRIYLYSWGLAYYLTFVEPELSTKKLDDYVSLEVPPNAASRPLARSDPRTRFERLVGQSLPDFERRWHAAMLGLK